MNYIKLTTFLIIILFTQFVLLAQGNKSQIIVGTKVAEPFVIKGTNGEYSGIAIDLWQKIAFNMKLQYEYREYDLEGLISAVANHTVDLSVSPMTITSEREERLDFSHPFFVTGLSIAVPSKEGGGLLQVLERFSSMQFLKIIGALLLLLFIIGFCTWLFERKKNKAQFGDGATKGLGSSFWWAAVTMTTVGYGDKAPVTTGGRLIALIWMFAGIIIISGFTAAITSALTVTQLDSNIRGVNDLYKVKVGTVKSSSSENFLISKGINYKQYTTIAEGIDALASGELGAVVYDAPILKYIIKDRDLSGELRVLSINLKPQYYGFALPFESKLREPLNRILLDIISQPDWQKINFLYLGE